MRSLNEYLFDPIHDKGVTLPVNRFEIFLSCVLGLAFMVGIVLFGEPWNPHTRNLLIGVIITTLVVFVLTRRRRSVLGLALLLVAARAVLGGILVGKHVVLLVLLGLGCAVGGWLLLRETQGW